MKKYIVDISRFGLLWYNLREFDTKEEAIKFCKEQFGADNKGNINLINEIDIDDDT